MKPIEINILILLWWLLNFDNFRLHSGSIYRMGRCQYIYRRLGSIELKLRFSRRITKRKDLLR